MPTTWIVAADSSRATTSSTPPRAWASTCTRREVERLVLDELPRDLSWFSTRDLEHYFANARAGR